MDNDSYHFPWRDLHSLELLGERWKEGGGRERERGGGREGGRERGREEKRDEEVRRGKEGRGCTTSCFSYTHRVVPGD